MVPRFAGTRKSAAWAREHRDLLALAAIVALAAVLRFATLGSQSLDHDETVTAARVLGHSFWKSMHVVFNGERNPPLYYAVAWLWSQLFGVGAVALRSLSAILGTLTVLAAYLAGRELASRRAGLLAAVLVAFNPYLIWYSQEARSYAMLVMWLAFAFYFFARALRRRDARSLTAWGVTSGLALCSHYFAVFVIAAEGAIMLVRIGFTRRVMATCAAVGAAGLVLLPLAVSQEGSGRGNGFTHIPVGQRAETAVVKYATVEGPAPQAGIASTTPDERHIALVAVALFVLAAATVAIRGSPRARTGAALAMTVAAAGFGAPLVLAAAGLDFFDPRNAIGALEPSLVAAGIGFSAARSRLLGAAVTLAGVVVFAVALRWEGGQAALQRHDWQAALAAVPRPAAAGLFVVPADGRAPLQYYEGGSMPHFDTAGFRDGIAVKRVVVISDSPAISPPGPRFELRSTQTAPQHWTIETFVAPTLQAIIPQRIAGTRVMQGEPSTGLVPHGVRAVELEQFVDTQGTPAGRGGHAALHG